MYHFFTNIENARALVKLLVPAFMAIVFLQSGSDKLFHRSGNLAYLNDFFKNTFLKPFTSILLTITTILEMTAGILCTLGVIGLFTGNALCAFWGLIFSALSFLSLLFGMRIAKDFAGSVSMATYMALNILGLLLLI